MVIINKDAQAKFISVLIILIIMALFVIAANDTLFNNTDEVNQSYNAGLNESFENETILQNESIKINETGVSDLNESTLNTTIETNQTESVNQTMVNESIVITEEVMNRSEIIVNESLINESNITIKPTLAMVVNGKSIFDDSYTQTYLSHYKNLSDVNFKNLTQRGSSALLKAGNVETKIEGFILDNKKYAIHLIACNRGKGTCNFRINGALAKDLSPDGINTHDLDDTHSIKIKSIIIDYCDNRKVCDYLLQSYDLVEIEVVRR